MTRHVAYSRVAPYPYGGANYVTLSVDMASESSPRVNGKLRLRANPFSLVTNITNATNHHGGGPAPFVYPHFKGADDPKIQRARNVAASNLRRKLASEVMNRNRGSLGVSIASAGQSIEMMRGASQRLIGMFEAAERFYHTRRGRKRLTRLRRLVNRGGRPTAGMVLEGFFGWAPAFEDFRSGMKTLGDPWPPSNWLSASQKWQVNTQRSNEFDGSWTNRSHSWSATGHESYSCNVSVVNPNVWVANKLGLVNPFSVAWDLVPWSFLINMVSNMGQVMGSLTDFAGLALTETSSTYSIFLTEDALVNYRDPRPNSYASGTGNRWTKARGRLVGVSPPSVVPYLRFPEWNIGSAAIVGSLLIQKASILSRVLGLGALTRPLD